MRSATPTLHVGLGPDLLGSIRCPQPDSASDPDPETRPSPASQVFRDVYKPKSARALLEAELGLEISDDAVKV